MRHVALLAVVAVLGIGLAGCGGGADTPDGVMKEMLGSMKELNSTLEGIKTADDLKAAEGKLNSIAADLKALKEKGDKMGMNELPKDQEEALKKKYEEDMKAVSKDMFTNLMRVSQIAATDPEAAKALDGLKNSMK